jgi:hypothetical protein
VTSDAGLGLEPQVEDGISGVRAQFPGHPIEVTSDGAGGVFTVVDDVRLGAPYAEQTTWLGFHISSAYPHSDVYPHYVGRVSRLDGRPHGEGMQNVDWRGRPALQLSRRSHRWNPGRDNAALKAAKVMAWFLTR